MAEQRKTGAGGKAGGFVANLVKDPKSPPKTTLLTGYLGDAVDSDRIRIYFDPELAEAADILRSDVLHVEEPNDPSPLAQTYVWVRAGAELKPVMAEATVAASYLSGRIAEENLGATQAYWAGGGGVTAARLAPSVFLPACPTRVPWACPTRAPVCFTRPWICRTLSPVACRSVLSICPTLQSWKCPSVQVFCTQPTVLNCPTHSPQWCPQPTAIGGCPTFGACPSAVDGCPSAPGGCWGGDPTIVFDPTIGGMGGMNMWG